LRPLLTAEKENARREPREGKEKQRQTRPGRQSFDDMKHEISPLFLENGRFERALQERALSSEQAARG